MKSANGNQILKKTHNIGAAINMAKNATLKDDAGRLYAPVKIIIQFHSKKRINLAIVDAETNQPVSAYQLLPVSSTQVAFTGFAMALAPEIKNQENNQGGVESNGDSEL